MPEVDLFRLLRVLCCLSVLDQLSACKTHLAVYCWQLSKNSTQTSSDFSSSSPLSSSKILTSTLSYLLT